MVAPFRNFLSKFAFEPLKSGLRSLFCDAFRIETGNWDVGVESFVLRRIVNLILLE